MSFILGLLGACLGIILSVAIIIGIILISLNKHLGAGNLKQILHAARNAKDIRKQEYSRIKNVSGMTKLMEPLILRDFNDFNKDMLYKEIENNLIKIFNAIENKSETQIKNDKALSLVYPQVLEQIQDMKSRSIWAKYDGIVFHTHAIKNYEKNNGMATITTSSTIEYYYDTNLEKEKYSDVKKQTRYTCKFVYIYDETKLGEKKEIFTVNCPNCGAPISGIGDITCNYCMSHIEPINLKLWKMSSYKEDYN